MRVKILTLSKLMQTILKAKRFSAIESRKITEVLLYAEMVGRKTQGIIKFFGSEPIQEHRPQHKPKIIKESNVSALINGGRNPAILVARMATKILINKCKKNGLAVVGINNGYASTGAIGFYASEIARNNLIGIVMSGTPKGVTPYGSIDKLIGINPIAFGIPAEKDPILLDMATSAITWYGLVRAQMLGEDLPEGVALDSDGNPTRNPEKAMKGAILTFGNSHKGSGLSLMIEMLTGPLIGATHPDSDGKWYNGSLFIAIDPKLLIGRHSLKKYVSQVVNKIKHSRVNKNLHKLMIPGEHSLDEYKKAKRRGTVVVDQKMYNNLLQLANST